MSTSHHSVFERISLALKALRELGLKQLGLYALYQFSLWSGHYRRVTTDYQSSSGYPLRVNFVPLPDPTGIIETIGQQGLASLLQEADEIVAGKVRLFGGQPVPLELTPPGQVVHWTAYERRAVKTGGGDRDIKFAWEPGRFGWACTLGRAYHLSVNEKYAQAFWRYTETFLDANPPDLGPHWSSAQEVALRLVALVFTARLFGTSPHSTPERLARLSETLVAHTQHIPPTLVYARAQNNNHLISEALGLYTAAAALPGHPHAPIWYKLGWRWLNSAFQTQITRDGAYAQHSTNYHRLMLQAALWAQIVQSNAFPDHPFPRQTLTRLASAVHWLLSLVDPATGRVPNLGPNDGAYILPLTICNFEDYRPVLQSTARVFLGEKPFPPGPWDEMGLWSGDRWQIAAHQQQEPASSPATAALPEFPPHVLRIPGSWAYLRAARFTSRPGHADQLHLDLWWRGLNITQDAGTYLYNAPPPWDNSLAHTAVHNTLMVAGQEQMTRAGRFLYLDWAQAEVTSQEAAADGSWMTITAFHDGYRRLQLTHQRQVSAFAPGRWVVVDTLSGNKGISPQTARLHWLLPDWPWEVDDQDASLQMRIQSPHGCITLQVSGVNPQQYPLHFTLIRAGERIYGTGSVSPEWGWTSPTYGEKTPALSAAVEVSSPLPLVLKSEWLLPE